MPNNKKTLLGIVHAIQHKVCQHAKKLFARGLEGLMHIIKNPYAVTIRKIDSKN
jgi:hypothetical protein